ncbi:ParB domain protein nuclease [Acidithiobacillus ferrivorans SS3]|uniref:ParB domain protein nuclease n=1 Tax=Acidithiobacillus ferrivorans SS3 TaxID=743299 RepID=G0JM63_9PROT|nr:ParB/RepB/Spo0J family partition protein [Acidithiobacillus ferrivorans]AEM48113.1 ParB domain protein nuclease [Acidithiobacillus ferrivorans SS3]
MARKKQPVEAQAISAHVTDPISVLMEQLQSALVAASGAAVEDRVARYNALVTMAAEHVNLPHPALGMQLVPVDTVQGNDYNPNKVAPPEMRLLQLSIAKDGMTMPVVVADDSESGNYTVVDGFHRTTVVKTVKTVRDSLAGYMPVVKLNKSIQDRITSTVRHNMARGTHQVELSAKLVTALKKHNWTNERIGMELGMDPDEVLRLKQITGLAEAFADKEFSRAWQ